jgi:hypothetical protein
LITKKVICLVLAALLLLPVLAGCGSNREEGDTSFTWWIIQGADTSYYARYEDNPAVRYMLSKEYNGRTVELSFMVPVAGSEQDNFNTLLATGEYADLMSLAMYNGSIVELYQEGIILDLTDYIDRYMPNYRTLLDNDPEVDRFAAHVVDGQRKYLGLLDFGDTIIETWCGYQYRRDWIVRYGRNPFDNTAFSGEWVAGEWIDNVIFPNGTQHPIYISDWEWMLEILARAIDEQGISDGYPMTIGSAGYFATGDLSTGFGGGGVLWYINPQNQIEFGAASENMRAYLQCMNTWFQRGWINRAFAERAQDMFYRIDDARVRQGKVGLWIGIHSQLGSRMDTGEGLLDGIVTFGARQPINDMYGGAAQQGQIPYSMYQISRIGGLTAVTSRASEKGFGNLVHFSRFIIHC